MPPKENEPNQEFNDKAGPANDDGRLEYTLSPAQLAKALNPPSDNSVVETIHGHKVSDPLRPLEKLDAPETAAWVDAKNAEFAAQIAGQKANVDKTIAFLSDAMNYARGSLADRYGDKYFSTFQDGLAPQPPRRARCSTRTRCRPTAPFRCPARSQAPTARSSLT
jgi:hypothetical protein